MTTGFFPLPGSLHQERISRFRLSSRERRSSRLIYAIWPARLPALPLLWIAAAIELRLQPSIIDCAHIHTNVSPVARGACVKASPGARHVGSFTESKRVIIAGVRSGKISHVT